MALLPLLTGASDNPLAKVLTVLLNAAMKFEREKHIRVAPYERGEERNGHRDIARSDVLEANGFKNRDLSTPLGKLGVSIPHWFFGITEKTCVRGANEPFRPQSLDADLLSEKALKVALAEMYVQGVSTRRVSAVLESLCGTSVSSMTVSRASAEHVCIPANWIRFFALGGSVLWEYSFSYNAMRSG